MYVIKDELDPFEGKRVQGSKNLTGFLVKEVTSGSGTIIPDPTWRKNSFSDWIRIQHYNIGYRYITNTRRLEGTAIVGSLY
jgi:hypothetical protein